MDLVWEDVYGFDMSYFKDVAYGEPLTDIVAEDVVVTKPSKLLDIDIKTVKIEDLAFKSEFSLVAKRNDFVHAYVVYFDITFTDCHKPVYFSTAPDHTPTHWKQTVFYLKDVISIKRGEAINGLMIAQPNEVNFREYDVTIDTKFSGEITSVDRKQFYRIR